MKKLTPAQTWAVLEVVFQRRVGICYALQKLKEVGLLSYGGYGERGPAKQALDKYARDKNIPHTWYWPVVETCSDEPRLSFIRAQRKTKKRRRSR